MSVKDETVLVTARAVREAVERHDWRGLRGLLAEDALLATPLDAASCSGVEEIASFLRRLFGRLDNLRFERTVQGPGRAVCCFSAELDGERAEGALLVHVGDSGVVEKLTLLLRPLPVLAELGWLMAEGEGEAAA